MLVTLFSSAYPCHYTVAEPAGGRGRSIDPAHFWRKKRYSQASRIGIPYTHPRREKSVKPYPILRLWHFFRRPRPLLPQAAATPIHAPQLLARARALQLLARPRPAAARPRLAAACPRPHLARSPLHSSPPARLAAAHRLLAALPQLAACPSSGFRFRWIPTRRLPGLKKRRQ